MFKIKSIGTIPDVSINSITITENFPCFKVPIPYENLNADIQDRIKEIVWDITHTQEVETIDKIIFSVSFFFEADPAYVTNYISVYFYDELEKEEIEETIDLNLTEDEWEIILNNAIFPYMLKGKLELDNRERKALLEKSIFPYILKIKRK